jgi:tRNA(adenine34) deaminase
MRKKQRTAAAGGHGVWMDKALTIARRAARSGEVPIAAILVRNGSAVASSFNRTRTWRDPTAHAEMVVLREAAAIVRNERLSDATLYVTLEPCAMCAGAIVQARVSTVVFAAFDEKAGACGSVLTVLPHPKLNHRPTVLSGVGAKPAARLLRSFFRQRRNGILRPVL